MKKLFSIFAFVFLVMGFSFAQPYTPNFYIKSSSSGGASRGCAPYSVDLGDLSGSTAKIYDYGDGTLPTKDSSHTYNTPGIYTVSQVVNTGTGSTDTLIKVNFIEVVDKNIPVQYEVEICEGGIVNFNFNNTQHDEYSVVFGDGNILTNIVPPTVVTHTYADNATKNIFVTCYYTPGGCSSPSAGATITPLNALIKPDISKLTVNDQSATGSITLTFDAKADQRYYVQQSVNGTGSYTNIDTLENLSGVQNLTYSNLNTSTDQYCYKIISYDDCGARLPSEEICSISNNPIASNNQNDLSWSAHLAGNVNTYTIYVNGGGVPLTSTSSTSYTHTPIGCGVDYCYQIVAELNQTDLNGNPLQSISATQCVTGVSNTIPAALQNLNSSVVSGSVQVMWDQPAGFSVAQYHISRSINGGSYSPYSNTSNNVFTDNGVSLPGNTYCYTVDYTDSCGNNSVAGGITCPVVLNVSIDNSNNYLNHLSWTSYSGQWPAGVQEYQVEVLDESNNIINTIPAGISFAYDDLVSTNGPQILRYRIKAIASGSPNVSYSNVVEIKYEGSVYLPNAFSPNGDGNNDVFFAKGQFIKDYKLIIYNRWGEVVYSTDTFGEGWDGSYQGGPATPDAYAYLVEVSDLWGKTITKRGSVTLLR